MSLAAFQSALARMVTDVAFREDVRTGGSSLEAFSLDERETRRLRAAAADAGLALTGTLVRSFRLGKVLTLLPMTRTLIGDARLGQEVRCFWAAQPPRSFYALEEAIAFADYLLHRPWDNPYAPEVIGFERALLELRRVRPQGEAPAPQQITFRHDPRTVLGPLKAGRRPGKRVRTRPFVVKASLDEQGEVVWE
jgi:hypothetical protein